MKGQRVAILVDSENIEIAVRKNETGRRKRSDFAMYPDWKKILPELVAGRTLVRLIYFKEKGRPLSKKFEKFWEEECHGELQRPTKSADPAIIMTAVTLADKMDAVIILSGDKDFIPLIPYLRAKGCLFEVASFESSAATELRRSADRYCKLTKDHVVELKRSRKE